MANIVLSGSATYFETIDGVLFLNSCIQFAVTYGTKTPTELFTVVESLPPSADCNDSMVRESTDSPSPLLGSFSVKALFFTWIYPSLAVGVTVIGAISKLRPTPMDADHCSPLGLAVADVLMAFAVGLFDGMRMLRVESSPTEPYAGNS